MAPSWELPLPAQRLLFKMIWGFSHEQLLWLGKWPRSHFRMPIAGEVCCESARCPVWNEFGRRPPSTLSSGGLVGHPLALCPIGNLAELVVARLWWSG